MIYFPLNSIITFFFLLQRSKYHPQENAKQEKQKLLDFILQKLWSVSHPEDLIHYFLLNRTIVTMYMYIICSNYLICSCTLPQKELLVLIIKNKMLNYFSYTSLVVLDELMARCSKKVKAENEPFNKIILCQNLV